MGYGIERPAKRAKVENNRGKARKLVMIQLPRDVIASILARLPARTLQKLRCACKSWDSLIREDHYLVSQHLNNQQRRNFKKPGTLSFYCTERCANDYTLNYSMGDNDGSSLTQKFDFSELLYDPSYFITNSCDGMIGVYGCNSFYIANPSIRNVRALPQGSPTAYHMLLGLDIPQAGLGYDGSTGEYKIVRLFNREYKRYTGCEVFSLDSKKTIRSWRLVDDPPFSADPFCVPVLVNGVLYWTVGFKYNTPEIALAFDVREEKFSVILHPEGSSKANSSWIISLGGCVCVSDTLFYGRMNIWTLQDPKNSKWVKQYNIDLSNMYEPRSLPMMWVRPLTIDDGRIIFSYGLGIRDYYDIRSRSFVKQEKIRNVDLESVVPYTESIVWPWPRFA